MQTVKCLVVTLMRGMPCSMHKAVISFLYMGSSQFSARMHSSAWQAHSLFKITVVCCLLFLCSDAHLTLVKRLGSLTDTAGETVGNESLLQDLEFSLTIHSTIH